MLRRHVHRAQAAAPAAATCSAVGAIDGDRGCGREVQEREARSGEQTELEPAGESQRRRRAGGERVVHVGVGERRDHRQAKRRADLIAGADDARRSAGLVVAHLGDGRDLGRHADCDDPGAVSSRPGSSELT